MMTTATPTVHPEVVEQFEALSTDQKLALLWCIYQEVGKSITPAAPGATKASPAIAEGLFQQVLAMSHDDQLQVQRDIIEGKDVLVSREYNALSDTTKLLFWYLLAQGMDRTEIIPMPTEYKLESPAEACMRQLQTLEFSEQITVLRELVSPMGNESTEV
jgi:Orange carotenoid protein, N-terminal